MSYIRPKDTEYVVEIVFTDGYGLDKYRSFIYPANSESEALAMFKKERPKLLYSCPWTDIEYEIENNDKNVSVHQVSLSIRSYSFFEISNFLFRTDFLTRGNIEVLKLIASGEAKTPDDYPKLPYYFEDGLSKCRRYHCLKEENDVLPKECKPKIPWEISNVGRMLIQRSMAKPNECAWKVSGCIFKNKFSIVPIPEAEFRAWLDKD